MAGNPNKSDLELWLDQEIIPRQNRLKNKFWEMLAEVGNSIPSEKLALIHAKSRGMKLSKGNELLGYPYQVLDLIRDFDPKAGLNIRVLNWFGHGLYLFVLIGKNHPGAPFEQLSKHKYLFNQSPSPWEYPKILVNNACTDSPTTEIFEKSTFYQWHKPILVSENINATSPILLEELTKLIYLLSK